LTPCGTARDNPTALYPLLERELPVILDVADDPRTWRPFLALPERLYRGDPHYCPPLRPAVLASLGRSKFFGRQRVLVAMNDRQALARVVARISPTLSDSAGKPMGMLGFFEAEDNSEAVRELLATAIRWLRNRGVRRIIGPMDGDTWHRYRFNQGPHDTAPFLMEPYNKPYYPAMWEACGFVPLESYYSKQVADVTPAAAALAPILARVEKRGYRLRKLVLENFREELVILHRMSCDIFAENFFYDPISVEDFIALYEPAKSLVDPELVWFAQAPDGQYVGFLFAVVDYQQAVASMGYSRGKLAKFKFLLNRRRADAVNMKSLGVTAAHRKSGLGAALMCRGYQQMLARGFRKANLCLIREGNPSGRLDGELGVVSRRYVLYQHSG